MKPIHQSASTQLPPQTANHSAGVEQAASFAMLLSRRHFCQRTAIAGATLLVAPVLLAGCGGNESAPPTNESAPSTSAPNISNQPKACETTNEADPGIRKALAYVDESPNVAKDCANCRFFKTAANGEACGGCEIITGPIAPAGYCNSWVERPA